MEKHREGQRKMKGGRTLMIEKAGKEKRKTKGGHTLMIENTGKEKKEDERWAYIDYKKGGEREKGR